MGNFGKTIPMPYTETSTKQSEHFEWLNAIDFYQSYLDIMEQRLCNITQQNGNVDKQKLAAYSDMLEYLKERVHDLQNEVNSQLSEMESADDVDNRLEMSTQSVHHFGLKEKFELFEEMLNGFRSEFNAFYVSNI
jgi:hypothetical protein